MRRKKVMIVQPIHERGVEFLRKEGFEVVFASNSSSEAVAREIKGVNGVIVRTAPFTKEIIEAAESLVVIGRHGVGIDNIDVEEASKRGIFIVNTPFANMVSVAEHTIGFMLALAKRLKVIDQATREGNFSIREEFASIDLDGKTLGIVGAGKVGSSVAKKCIAGFNMKVLAYDPYLSKEKAEEIGVTLCDLPKLLRESDFVSLHVPLTSETNNLIEEKELRLMKSTAFLINMARGPIVDEMALLKALKERWISGAATDVFIKEPPDPNSPLFALDNIILSPHMAALTEECVIKMATGAAEGVADVLKGKRPKYLANIELLKKYK